MSQPVIAAIDPHRDDPGAAALAVLLARATGAPLLLASAYAADPPDDAMDPEHARAMRDETELELARVRARVQERAGPQIAVTATAVPDGAAPAGALQRLAERKEAALIVVGSSGRGPAGRMLPGAVTDRVLHGAPCPVAVAPAGYGTGEAALALIAVAFVDRADGRTALAHGCELAAATGGLVRVLTVREPTDWRFTGPLDAEQLAAAERARDEAAEHTLLAGVGAVPESRSAGGELLSGRPRDALAAASADADLLVCGSRGHGPVRTLLLGGVSHALVRQAACPVLVVPLARPDRATLQAHHSHRTAASGAERAPASTTARPRRSASSKQT